MGHGERLVDQEQGRHRQRNEWNARLEEAASPVGDGGRDREGDGEGEPEQGKQAVEREQASERLEVVHVRLSLVVERLERLGVL